MRTFGCIAHVKVTRPHVTKLDDRSIKMVFLGYEPGSKGYRVYDPARGRLHVSRDVVFDEAKGLNWADSGDNAVLDTFTVEYTVSTTAPAQPEDPVSPAASPRPQHTTTRAGARRSLSGRQQLRQVCVATTVRP